LPKDHRFAVEIRNKKWLVLQFIEALRERGVALALIDQSWMPRPGQWFEKFDPITADFTYVCWLGDRKGIEETTKVWDQVIVDRYAELSEWEGPQAKDSDIRLCQQSLCRVWSGDRGTVPAAMASKREGRNTAGEDGDTVSDVTGNTLGAHQRICGKSHIPVRPRILKGRPFRVGLIVHINAYPEKHPYE
jgi:hypothetical protein